MKVPVREFKAKLSRYLKDVRAGRDVVVTSRGRPVARLMAVPDETGERLGAEELIRRLKLVPGIRLGTGGKPLGAKRPIRIGRGRKTFAQIVLEERR